MNISLGGAVSPSTKRARSPRIPGAAAEANRDVAPSRVGKKLRRRWGPGVSLAPPPRRAAVVSLRRQELGSGQVNQTSDAIGRIELDSDGQKPEIGDA